MIEYLRTWGRISIDSQNRNSIARIALELVALSCVVLFQELTLIRWLGTQIPALAYFPNLILISAFLGLGIGCLLLDRRSLVWLWPVSFLLVTLAGFVMSRIVFTQEGDSDHLWLLYYNLSRDSLVVKSVLIPIVIAFVLGSLSFVSLGQMVAHRLQQFRERSSALWGYTWDILGSLLGVIGFTVASFAKIFPVYWFLIVILLGFIFMWPYRRCRYLHLLCGLVVLFLVAQTERAQIYSPYYALSAVEESPSEIAILANGSLHQVAINTSRENRELSSDQELVISGYNKPYELLKSVPKKVLVLGAGTGNDVAVLLNRGVEKIDAVEIDPEIIQLGRQVHPEHPYGSERVTIYNTDARSFLNNSSEKYDLVVFGTLDSMTRLSALSNVRLDNFVYTLDAIQAARNRLSEDGGIVLYFMVGKEYIHRRLMGVMTEVFDQVPLVNTNYHKLFNRIYMAGPAFEGNKGDERRRYVQRFKENTLGSTKLSSDDWPYLYLEFPSVSPFYLTVMGVLAGLSLLAVVAVSRDVRRAVAFKGSVDWELFLFGMAFLLLETRSVTCMNLVWGATWFTNAVVFGSILSMVLLATLFVQLRPSAFQLNIGGLIATLLFAYFFPLKYILGLGVFGKLFMSFLIVGAPIFFASACFALLFSKRESAGKSFGWNILGAVAGGLIEFSSMQFGLRALLLVALLAYLGAFLFYTRRNRVRVA